MEVRKTRADDLAREEALMENYAKMRRDQHQNKIQDQDVENKKSIESLATQHEKRVEELEKAYKVELSRKIESNDKILADIQTSFDKRLKEEKETHDKAFEQLSKRERSKVEAYRKKQEEVMTKLHDEYQRAQETMKG